MRNKLNNSDSLYLRQHASDPVYWCEWGSNAFESAKEDNRPVFLSIGYSSCHWCHVMAHESFQDEETAAVLNRSFVCIKVDREERPDVDDTYMTAVQLATGHGGWPISAFLTPDKEPFYVGTYFPKESRGDYPGFRHLASSIAAAWEGQQEEVKRAAREFAESLSGYLSRRLAPKSGQLTTELIDSAVRALHDEFDFERGGFGTAPKFPPHSTIRFLLDYASRRHLLPGDNETVSALSEQAGHMALMTLEEMALGGIHDHVGGGFHRYSTDADWRLPHFEKMLSDNALLVALYAHAAHATGDERLRSLFSRTAESTMDWIESALGADDGTYGTAVDADSEGEEGAYYTWSLDEVRSALPEDWRGFAEAFGLEEEGNFLDEATRRASGRNVLYLDQDDQGGFARMLLSLKGVRGLREHPAIDEKAIASLNGLALTALVRTGRIDRASRCAEAWSKAIAKCGHVPHLIGSGRGYLDDCGDLANGLLDLYEATKEEKWLIQAKDVVARARAEFASGDLYTFTGDGHERLFARAVPALDGATPSPLAEFARAMYRLGDENGARRTLLAALGWMQSATRASHSLLHVAFVDMIEHPDADRTTHPNPPSVSVRLEPEEAVVSRDGWAEICAVITVPEGCHIVSNVPKEDWLVPLSLKLEGALGEASFPESDGTYEGTVMIPIRVRPGGKSVSFQVTVRCQVCSQSECHLPHEQTAFGTVVVPQNG